MNTELLMVYRCIINSDDGSFGYPGDVGGKASSPTQVLLDNFLLCTGRDSSAALKQRGRRWPRLREPVSKRTRVKSTAQPGT